MAACLIVGMAGPRAGAQFRLEPEHARFWIASGIAVAASLATDASIRDFASDHQSSGLDHFARDLDPFGRARYILPALALSYAVPRLAHRNALASAVVRVGLGYIAADAVEATLKPVVGRHRPDDTARPFRFRAFSRGDEWHSFPSAHTVHAFAIAAALADEAHRPLVTVLAYTGAALVGLERVYSRAHWMSDVAGSTALAVSVSLSVDRALRRARSEKH